jgi:hypothetical protein
MLLVVGVPLSVPVLVLNVAHPGRPKIEKVSVPPLGLEAVGVNEYALPAVTDVAGVPEMVGSGTVTVIVNGASEALAVPSLTEIVMLGKLPAFAVDGVPLSWPFVVLNVAQLGLFVIEKLSVPPRGLDAVGVKLYACPDRTEVAGAPEIVGGASTVIVNGASEALPVPSLTEIVTLEYVPA